MLKIEEAKSFFKYPKYYILWLKFFASDIKDTPILGLVQIGTYQIRIANYYYDEFIQIDSIKEFDYKQGDSML